MIKVDGLWKGWQVTGEIPSKLNRLPSRTRYSVATAYRRRFDKATDSEVVRK
ncbi:hypothetical protein BH10BAC4_BH10BAC4_26090 [soil metagenome]